MVRYPINVLITCDEKYGSPSSFNMELSEVMIFLGIIILIVCLIILVTCLQKILIGLSTRIILSKETNINALIPFIGLGAICLEQMLPFTLQANIATSFTGLLKSLVCALQVVLCRLFFNITGIIPRFR